VEAQRDQRGGGLGRNADDEAVGQSILAVGGQDAGGAKGVNQDGIDLGRRGKFGRDGAIDRQGVDRDV